MSCCSEAATSYSWSYELASCFALFPFFFLLWKQDTSDLFYTPGPVPCWDTVPLSLLVVLPASRAGRCENHDANVLLILNYTLRSRCSPPHSDRDCEENEKQCALNGAGRGSFSAHLSHQTLWGSCVVKTVICDTRERELWEVHNVMDPVTPAEGLLFLLCFFRILPFYLDEESPAPSPAQPRVP